MSRKHNFENNLAYMILGGVALIAGFIESLTNIFTSWFGSIENEEVRSFLISVLEHESLIVFVVTSVFFITFILIKRKKWRNKRDRLIDNYEKEKERLISEYKDMLAHISRGSLWLSKVIFVKKGMLENRQVRYHNKLVGLSNYHDLNFKDNVHEICARYIRGHNKIYADVIKELVDIIKLRVDKYLKTSWDESFSTRIMIKTISSAHDDINNELKKLFKTISEPTNFQEGQDKNYYVDSTEVDSASKPFVHAPTREDGSERQYIYQRTALKTALNAVDKVFVTNDKTEIPNYVGAPNEDGYDAKLVVPVYFNIGKQRSYEAFIAVLITNPNKKSLFNILERDSDPIIGYVRSCAVQMAMLRKEMMRLQDRIIYQSKEKMACCEGFHGGIERRKG